MDNKLEQIRALQAGETIRLLNDPDDDMGPLDVIFLSADFVLEIMTVYHRQHGEFLVGFEQFDKSLM